MVGGEGAPSTPGTQRPPTAEDLVRRVLPPDSPAPESPSGPIPVRTPVEKKIRDAIDKYTHNESMTLMTRYGSFLPGSKYMSFAWRVAGAKNNLDDEALWMVKGGRATPIPLSALKGLADRYNMESEEEFIDAIVKGNGLVYGRDKENEQYHNTRYAIYGFLVLGSGRSLLKVNKPISMFKLNLDAARDSPLKEEKPILTVEQMKSKPILTIEPAEGSK